MGPGHEVCIWAKCEAALQRGEGLRGLEHSLARARGHVAARTVAPRHTPPYPQGLYTATATIIV